MITVSTSIRQTTRSNTQRIRYTLLVLALIATVFAGGSVLAATTQTAATAVTVNIAEAIEVVSWPDTAILLTNAAVPGQPVISGALRFTVRCNSTWGIQVKSDEAAGSFREFDVSTNQYVADGRLSQSALEWSNTTSGPWTPVSSMNTSFIANQPATSEVGTTVSFYLRYIPGFNDIPLAADRIYHITLTYTAAVGY